MPLPPITLDDRTFQGLVTEARARVAQRCQEWSEHNVSDPGITLIEQFAWMTDMLLYRLNQVPDKIHVELLDLLGVQLRPGSAARTDIRFLLTAPPVEPVALEAGALEVGTVRTVQEESTIFQLRESRTIAPLAPVAYVLLRRPDASKVDLDREPAQAEGSARGRTEVAVGVEVTEGIARPRDDDRAMFSERPRVNEAIYLGFGEDISRLLLEVSVEVESARGTGMTIANAPLQWSFCSEPDVWHDAEVLEDGTEGFNGSGRVVVELPGRSVRTSVGGRSLHWLRCAVVERRGSVAYTASPRVLSVTAAPIGAILPAHHAAVVDGESLGLSDGTPAQRFELLHPPMLEPSEDEWLEVRRPGGDWERWDYVESFAESGPEARHYGLDLAHGIVELGPAIRREDGAWEQYGETPPAGSQLRMARYRHGGGLAGNLAPRTLTVLKEGPAGIALVTNPHPAAGGVDPEGLEAARVRGPMVLRARDRAVTKEDFEHLATRASSRVARAVCISPDGASSIGVRILPAAVSPDRRLGYRELSAPRDLLEDVARFLDERRLLGATIDVATVGLRGIGVDVEVQVERRADPSRIEAEILEQLHRYLNPHVGGTVGALGDGWEFGRTLNQGELFGVVHAVSGVEWVKELTLYESNLATGERSGGPAGSHITLAPYETLASARHRVKTVVVERV